MSWQHHLRNAWTTKGPLARALWPVNLISRAAVAAQRRQARQQQPGRAKVPVVILGNVIAGGAGKTPAALALTQALIDHGETPLIISKGYGRQPSRDPHFLVHRRMTAAQAGDEPLLMAQARLCPVIVTDARRPALDWALAKHPETTVVLFDDGLQDLSLAADVELLVFDARGTGNGWLIPAGPLREPWPRRTWRHRAQVLHVLSTTAHEQAPELDDLQGPLWQVTRGLKATATRLDDTVSTNLAHLARQPVQAMAGIAKPEQFFNMLKAAGLDVQVTHAMADHAHLDLAFKRLQAGMPVLVTAKDAVKLTEWPAEWQARTWVLHLDFALPEGLVARVLQAVRERRDELSSRHGQNTA